MHEFGVNSSMKEPKNRKYKSESWHTPSVCVSLFLYIYPPFLQRKRDNYKKIHPLFLYPNKIKASICFLLCQYLNYLFTIRRLAFPYTTRNDVKQRQHFHIQTIFRFIFRLKLCQDSSTMTTVGLLLKSSETSYRRII